MVSSYETDIRLPSYEVLVKIATLFGVTVDYLLCREDKRFIDISSLSDDEAAVVCDMINILLKRNDYQPPEWAALSYVATEVGFEPTDGSSPPLVFKTSAINRTRPLRHITGFHIYFDGNSHTHPS